MGKVLCYLATILLCRLFVQGKPIQNNGDKADDLSTDMTFLLTMGYENSNHQDDIVELDIKVDHPSRIKRTALTSEHRKWEGGIVPYVFDKTEQPLSSKAETEIKRSMAHIAEKTCIKFIPRTKETSYVNFTRGQGCSSYVGRINRPQTIDIGENCATFSVIVHEIIHALGFFHEHTRLDRDTYVTINHTNIKNGFEDQFNKYDDTSNAISTFNLPYDKQSVMHYSRFTFSKHADVQTKKILPLKEYMTIYSKLDYKETLGNQNGMSSVDAQRVNIHYNCPKTTTTTTTTKSTLSTNYNLLKTDNMASSTTGTLHDSTSQNMPIVSTTRDPNSANGITINLCSVFMFFLLTTLFSL